MILTGESQSTQKETCFSATFSTEIPHSLAWDETRFSERDTGAKPPET